MDLTISREGDTELPDYAAPLLRKLFPNEAQVIVKREFRNARSGSRVYLIQPIGQRQAGLPVVVKLAATSLIEREWTAYQRVKGMLYGMMEVQSIALPDPSPQGALCYPFRGGSLFEAVSLQEAYHQHACSDIVAIVARLFRALQSIHNQSAAKPGFFWRASYDHLLPPNLLIDAAPIPDVTQRHVLTPRSVGCRSPDIGDWVSLEGFAVTKVDLVKRTVTLNLPRQREECSDSFMVRAKWAHDLPTLREGQSIPVLKGKVRSIRRTELETQINRALGRRGDAQDSAFLLSDGVTFLPNPLTRLPQVLDQHSNVRIALIHGDLNLDNVLVDTDTGHVSLIDVTEAREDHVLHDFLRLETEVMTKLVSREILASGMSTDLTVLEFYRQLHCSTFASDTTRGWVNSPSALEKPYQVLQAIRRAAQRHFYADTPTEYYQGLLIYLLGALKLANLDVIPSAPLPKQVALWAAAAVCSLLEAPSPCQESANTSVKSPRKPDALVIDYEPEVKLRRGSSNQLADVDYGTHLYRGDVIHTYTGAHALIHCHKGPAFEVPPERTQVIDCDGTNQGEWLFQPDLRDQDPVQHLVDGLTSSLIAFEHPPSPILLSPRNTTIATSRPSFTWRPVAEANSYRLEVRMPGGIMWSRETGSTTLPYPNDAHSLSAGSTNTVVLTAIGTKHPPDTTQLRCLETDQAVGLETFETEIQQRQMSESGKTYLLSKLYQHCQMWGEAVEKLEYLIDAGTQASPELRNELAGLYSRMKLYGEAQKHYEQALDISHTDEVPYGEACLGLAHVAKVQGNLTKAVAHLRQAARTEYADLAQRLAQYLESQHVHQVYQGPANLVDYVRFLAVQIVPALKEEIRDIAAPLLARLQRMSQLDLRPTGTWASARLGSNDFNAMGILAATYIATATLIIKMGETGAAGVDHPGYLVDLAHGQAEATFSEFLDTVPEDFDALVESYVSLTAANAETLYRLANREET